MPCVSTTEKFERRAPVDGFEQTVEFHEPGLDLPKLQVDVVAALIDTGWQPPPETRLFDPLDVELKPDRA